MKKLVYSFLFASLSLADASAMEQEGPVKPAVSYADALNSLPREIQLFLAAHAGNTLEETGASIRSLAVTNKNLYRSINNPQNSLTLMNLLTHRFSTTRLTVALHLRSTGIGQWLKTQIGDDKNGEFAVEVIEAFTSAARNSAYIKSKFAQDILRKTLTEARHPLEISFDKQYSPEIIQAYITKAYSNERFNNYQKISFLLKYIPNIVNQTDVTEMTNALKNAVLTNNPETVALLLKADAYIYDSLVRLAITRYYQCKAARCFSFNNHENSNVAIDNICKESDSYAAGAILELILKSSAKPSSNQCTIQ